jgi:hypothetical protein
LRSSTDKSLALGFAYGCHTFVCDNLAYRADRVIAKKHTVHAVDRYFEAICKCVSDLASFKEAETVRIRAMQSRIIDDHFAESFLLRAYQDESILSPRSLPLALAQWRQPTFPNLEEKNAWRLHAAITHALVPRAKSNPAAHLAATLRLGALLQDEAPQAPAFTPATA